MKALAVIGFLGAVVFIVITLADIFIGSLLIAVPYVGLCFLIDKVVKLWQHP